MPFAINLTLFGDSVTYSGKRKKGWALEKSKEREGKVFTAEGKGAALTQEGRVGTGFMADSRQCPGGDKALEGSGCRVHSGRY